MYALVHESHVTYYFLCLKSFVANNYAENMDAQMMKLSSSVQHYRLQ